MSDHGLPRLVVLAVSVALLFSCAKTASRPVVSPPNTTASDSRAELKRQYETAQGQYERRAVSLKAIEKGVIQPGRPVTSVDSIFGSDFASDLPSRPGATEKRFVYFGERIGSPSRPDGVTVAFGYIGWSMAVEYDNEGKIQRYYLSNLWKTHSSVEQGMEGQTPIPQLRTLYESAQSAGERRDACLRAIDEGAVRNHSAVTQIDALFGTQLASQLPKKKEANKVAFINFVSPSGAAPEKRETQGWFLAVEYDYSGNIQDYYLTNVPTR